MPPAIPERIPCESAQEFEQELGSLREALSFQETEETWERIARALTRFGAIVKGGGYKFEKELVNGMKASHKPIASSMNSERTRLSAAALECIGIIAPRIGLAFDALVPLFISHILRLATRSNKVYVTRSQSTMGLILGYCHIPSIVPYLLFACKESKIVTGRAVALEGVLRCLNKWDWAQQDIKAKVGDVEEIIRITGRDKDAGIRQTSRKVFEAYKILFPERVEEFTGPLTPVMRKYLDIQPLPHGKKPIERVRLQSAAERPRGPPVKGNLAASTSSVPSSTIDRTRTNSRARVRTKSRNAVTGTSSRTPVSTSPDGVSDSRAMPPPAAIPTHARNPALPRAESRPNHLQEKNARYERQRVVSTTSSTHSTQSAPANSHSIHDHRPPVRLATSQTHSSRPNPAVAGSSGKARRVRKEVPVEPHSSNLRDPLTMAHRAPIRTMKGPARQLTQGASSNALGVVFPTSESGAAQTQRKGAQRVPKPAPPAPVSSPTPSMKIERPATVMGVVSKGEVKPSIFRRGARVPGAGAEEPQKKQDGFAPRRGGVAQPTLSQLSKQKAQKSASGATSHVPKSRALAPAPTPANRPAWGVGVSKTGATKILPVLRGQGGASRAQTPKLAEDTQVDPVMIPLPVSPGRERDKETMAQLAPLPASPKAETSDSEPTEVPLQETGIAEDALAAVEVNEHKGVVLEEMSLQETEIAEDAQAAVEVNEHKEVVLEEMRVADEIVDSLDEQGHEMQANIGEPVVIVQEEDTNGDVALTVARMKSPHGPGTPPFPMTDEESDEDELEGIEFTSGDVYAPGGVPIKTPRKLAALETANLTERSPLGDVVLNA